MLAACVITAWSTLCAGETRSWTDASGSIEFVAEFVKVNGDWVHIRRQDGSLGRIPLRWLSEADQIFVAKPSSQVSRSENNAAKTILRPAGDTVSSTVPERVELPPRTNADKMVDGFIAYDIGELRGAEGLRAREEFERLGSESVGALVRGLNESAQIGNSCPIMVLRSRLSCCLSQARDPRLDVMAASNLCCGVPRNAPHYRLLADLRAECINRLPQDHPLREIESRTAQLVAQNNDAAIDHALQSTNVTDRRAAISAVSTMGPRFGLEMITALADSDEMVRQIAHAGLVALARNVDYGPPDTKDEQACIAAATVWGRWYKQQVQFALPPQAWRASSAQLRKWCDHPDPNIRTIAVIATRHRRIYLVGSLIDLLNDPSHIVRREAHNALVDLAEGADFGPAEGSNHSAIAAAVDRWKLWEDRRRQRFRSAAKTDEQILTELQATDDEIRLAAASTAVLRELPIPTKLVPLLTDRVPEIRQSARQGLIHLASGLDYGPRETADASEQADSAKRWAIWAMSYTPPVKAGFGVPDKSNRRLQK